MTSTLRANVLSYREVLANNIANIAPAIAVFFVFGTIVSGTGVGAPLIVLVAGVAMLFHANTTAEFNKVTPSSGFYATFISRSLGQRVGRWLSMAYVFGYLGSYVAVTYQIGVWTNTALQSTFGINLPWWVAALVFQALAVYLAWRGVRLSVRVTVSLFLFELLMILVAAVAILATHAPAISLAGFVPSHVQGGFGRGLGFGFPLAIFLFVGTSASSPLAEEAHEARTTLPRSIMTAILFAIVLFVFLAWVQGIGFNNNTHQLVKSAFPFITAASRSLPILQPLLYLAGLTSAMAVLLSVVNGSARVFYNVAQQRLLPRTMTRIHDHWATPSISIGLSAIVAAAITIGLSLFVGAGNGFAYSATLGTDIYVVIYIAANVALPIYFWTRSRSAFSWIRHGLVPVVGIALLAYPFWISVSPHQPPPYDLFGLFLLIVLVGTAIYGATRRGYLDNNAETVAERK